MTPSVTGLPNIGIRLHGGLTAMDCTTLAVAADEAGFSTAWFAENAFDRGILPAATACAIATRRLEIAAGVFNPFSRHPTMMAMEIAALDELASGRACLSIGAGIAASVEKIGFDPQKPLTALRDSLVIIRGLLGGEPVDYAGKAFSARQVSLGFAGRAALPIFLAGRGSLTARLAGELADGLIVSNMCSVAFGGARAAEVAAARSASGRNGSARIVQFMPCAIAEDGDAARVQAKRAVAAMVPGFWRLAQKVASAKQGLLAGTAIAEADFAAATAALEAGKDGADVLDDRFTDAFSIAGTPSECRFRMEIYARSGITDLGLTFAEADGASQIELLAGLLR